MAVLSAVKRIYEGKLKQALVQKKNMHRRCSNSHYMGYLTGYLDKAC